MRYGKAGDDTRATQPASGVMTGVDGNLARISFDASHQAVKIQRARQSRRQANRSNDQRDQARVDGAIA